MHGSPRDVLGRDVRNMVAGPEGPARWLRSREAGPRNRLKRRMYRCPLQSVQIALEGGGWSATQRQRPVDPSQHAFTPEDLQAVVEAGADRLASHRHPHRMHQIPRFHPCLLHDPLESLL